MTSLLFQILWVHQDLVHEEEEGVVVGEVDVEVAMEVRGEATETTDGRQLKEVLDPVKMIYLLSMEII